MVRNQIASAVAVGGSVRDYLVAVGQQLGTTPEALKQAFQQLAAGHVAGAVQTLYSAVLTPFVLPILTTSILTDVQAAFRKPVQNMLNVIDTAITSPSGAGWVLAAGFPLLAVMSDVVTATGDGLQNIVNGLNARNLAAVVNAIVAMPGRSPARCSMGTTVTAQASSGRTASCKAAKCIGHHRNCDQTSGSAACGRSQCPVAGADHGRVVDGNTHRQAGCRDEVARSGFDGVGGEGGV